MASTEVKDKVEVQDDKNELIGKVYVGDTAKSALERLGRTGPLLFWDGTEFMGMSASDVIAKGTKYQIKSAPTTGNLVNFDHLLDVVEASPPIDEAKSATVTDISRPFVNRKRELLELCYFLVINIERCHAPEDQAVTKRKTLMLSAQMFGSGKTTLGSNFLLQVHANPELIALCKSRLKGKVDVRDSAFTHLLSLQYVLVNLMEISELNKAYKILIRALMKVELKAGRYQVGKHPNLRQALNFKELSFCQIVRAFEDEFGHYYFVQFDDIGDLLLQDGFRGCANLLNDISAIQANLVPKSLVYVTSRSPLFYLLGTKLLKSDALPNWTSPSSARCVVLDSLRVEHIQQMIPKNEMKDAEREEIASVICMRTGGVPRFVVGALDMLAVKSPDEWLSAVEGQSLLQHLIVNFKEEIYCWQAELMSNDSAKREIAVELIRIASLSMPFSLNENLDLGWSQAIKARLPEPRQIELTAIPILLCSIFPLYITKITLEQEEKDLWKFVIPPVCLEVITSNEERLPFIPVAEGLDPAKYLEVAVARCVRLRVSDSLVRTRGQKAGVLLPFLALTLVGEEEMKCSGYATFPKLVTTKKELTNQALQKLMEEGAKGNPSLQDVNRNQLQDLLRLMPPDVVIVPREQSNSADLFYLTSLKHLIEWQMKAGAQVLQPAAVVDELLKSSYQHIGDPITSLTFIFVCVQGVSSKFLDHAHPTRETNFAYYFEAGAQFTCKRVCSVKDAPCKNRDDCEHAKAKVGDFVVSANMEVLILKDAGLRCLLTDVNLRALSGPQFTLKTARHAISPYATHKQGAELDEVQKLALNFDVMEFND